MSETQGADVAFYDASEGQEQALHEPRPASEAPPVAQVTPPAPPSTPVVSPALSAAQIAPETPTRARCAPCSSVYEDPVPPPRTSRTCFKEVSRSYTTVRSHTMPKMVQLKRRGVQT